MRAICGSTDCAEGDAGPKKGEYVSQIIGYIIFGFIAGLVARAITPGRQHMGFAVTSILGIAGSLLAGWLGRMLGWYGPDGGAGFIMSTAGAVLLLFIYHLAARKMTPKGPPKDKDFPRRVA
jgi:uncharacterized membrane protein YeaQ/YmgE (transglycosylase-associated protein family)